MEPVAKWKSTSCILIPPSCTPPDGWLQSRCWQHQLCSLRACSACVATWSGEPGMLCQKFVQKVCSKDVEKQTLWSWERQYGAGKRTELQDSKTRLYRVSVETFLFQVTDPFTRPTRGTAERGSTSSPAKGCCFNVLMPVNSFILVRCFKQLDIFLKLLKPLKTVKSKNFILKKSVWSCCPLKRARLKVPNDWWQPQSHQVPPGDPINNSKCTEIRKPISIKWTIHILSNVYIYIYTVYTSYMCVNNHHKYVYHFICFSLESFLLCVCLVYVLLFYKFWTASTPAGLA